MTNNQVNENRNHMIGIIMIVKMTIVKMIIVIMIIGKMIIVIMTSISNHYKKASPTSRVGKSVAAQQ